jgi:hypothetical protein
MDRKQKLVIARRYRKYIRDLEKQQEKFYLAALEELKIPDNGWAFEYLYNDTKNAGYRKLIIQKMFEAENVKEV